MTRSHPLRPGSLSPSSPIDFGRRIAARHVAAACAVGMGLVTMQASAVTFTVTQFDDDGFDGTCNANCTLREAIEAANDLDDPATTIKFKPSTTPLTITLKHTGFAYYGDLSIREPMTIVGPGAGMLTIVGDGDERVLTVDPLAAHPITIKDLTISGGVDTTTGGGGIRVGNNFSGARLTLDGVVVQGNTSTANGGGILLDKGTLVLTNSQVFDNDAQVNGNGIAADDTSTSHARQLLIQNSTIRDNDVVTTNTSGGGLWLDLSSPAVIEGSTISGNAAGATGGGIFINATQQRGEVLIRNSTIENNESPSHGAGVFVVATNRPVVIENSTITDNDSTNPGFGGGVYVFSSNGLLQIRNTTITGNYAGKGGGIYLFDDVLLQNSIVADNDVTMTGNDADGFANSHVLSVEKSVVVNGTGPSANFTMIGNAIDKNPLLPADPADYGGPTRTHALPNNSSAIDFGDPAVCSYSNANKDQRGVTRLIDGSLDGDKACDIGAYEFNGNTVACPTTPTPAGTCNNGIAALKGSISIVNATGTKTDSFKAALTGVNTLFTDFFGDPTGFLGTPAAVCLYANNVLVGSYNVPAGGVNATGAALWKLASSGQTSFSLSTGNADGVTSLVMKPSPTQMTTTGAATLLTKTGAVTVPYDPNAVQGSFLTDPVVLQFRAGTATDECVTTSFSGAQITSNTPAKFTAVK